MKTYNIMKYIFTFVLLLSFSLIQAKNINPIQSIKIENKVVKIAKNDFAKFLYDIKAYRQRQRLKILYNTKSLRQFKAKLC